MRMKSFLLGSAAALVAVSGARAADAVVVAEPEPVEYVRVCDAYGMGFFYIPGTETCLKVSGYVRYDAQGGDDVYNGGELGTWVKHTRAEVRFDARSEPSLARCAPISSHVLTIPTVRMTAPASRRHSSNSAAFESALPMKSSAPGTVTPATSSMTT